MKFSRQRSATTQASRRQTLGNGQAAGDGAERYGALQEGSLGSIDKRFRRDGHDRHHPTLIAEILMEVEAGR